jgi:diguanylate cyclase (GGDEF)-like protein/PAS domain S-box-containing protein
MSSGVSQKFRGAPLWLLVFTMLLTVLAWSAWNTHNNYQILLEQEYRLLEVRARQREARISGTLRSVDLMMGSIIDDLHDRPKMSDADQVQLLRNYLRQLPEIRSLLVTEPTGRVRAHTNEKVIGFDASTREYFKIHLGDPTNDRFHISLPFQTVTGVTATTLSRVVRDTQGRFAGVVVATLESAFFAEALKLSVFEAGIQSLLINLSGDILSMVPPSDLIGKNLRGGIAYTEHINTGEATTRHLNQVKLEQTLKISVFHDLPGAPLAVVVSRDHESFLAEWRDSLYSSIASFVLLACTALLLLRLAARRQTDLIRAQEKLSASELELRTIVETEPECVKILAADGSLLKMNPAGLKMIEADSWEQAAGAKVPNIIAPAYRKAFMSLVRDVCAGGSGQLEFEIIGLKGGHRWLDTHAVPIPNPDGEGMVLLGVTRDITQRKEFEALQDESRKELEQKLLQISELQLRLQEQVIRDPLSGLFNRRYLDETLPRELSRAKREGYPLAVVMIDLDHFKQVNDTYGHAAGDEVLKALAALLKKSARESDIVCRYGGEEFLVALPRMSPDQALQRVEAWRLELADTSIQHGDLKMQVTLSAGVAGFPDHGADIDSLLSHADEALYRAKHAGRNRVSCHTPL